MTLQIWTIQLTAAAIVVASFAVVSFTGIAFAESIDAIDAIKRLDLPIEPEFTTDSADEEASDTVPGGAELQWENRPDAEEPPGRREPGGAFGSNECPRLDRALTALVPGLKSDAFATFTTQANPNFWFYVPYGSELDVMAEFAIVDLSNDELVYEQREPLTEIPGIARVSPTLNLAVGRTYYWEFAITCGDSDRVYVGGTIERISPLANLPDDLNERIILYAREGLWYETLSSIVDLYSIDPVLARERLRELFEAEGVDLGAFVEVVHELYSN
ncbi:MAG: DUF928 domain-containing protein [Cyanobacteria bacterium SID2]|nr:DUF928 domain-containing protein [Cyanobacteria bacterium SID2]MBP0002103.1 DUF928 domain-containing protein [Cyanobacteria bacterium SBC]